MNLWPHQARALEQIDAARRDGERRIVVAAPTGAGKSLIMRRLIESGERVALYTNRRMLLEQTADSLRADGIAFGTRASGHEPNFLAPVQLCSVQTEDARVLNGGSEHHRCDLVLIDEAHQNKAGVMEQLAAMHLGDGATILGFTATPLGVGHMYDRLIVAAYNSELRRCGAHVPADMFAPTEPVEGLLKSSRGGDFTEASVKKAMPVKRVFGHVLEHWTRLNPDRKATILFAPGVPESRWLAEEFNRRGYSAAHIDGEGILINGEELAPTAENRERLRHASESGEVEIICNRFVMREGIDMPWLEFAVFATAFGSLTSYLQAGGRLLRSHPSHRRVTAIDHGGNFHRHGSLNADRDWDLGADDYRLTRERADRMRQDQETEPIVCPSCKGVRAGGKRCPHCGYEHTRRVRAVLQLDGTLKAVDGKIYRKPKVTRDKPELQRLWESTYWGAARKGAKPCSFNQLAARFAYKARQAGHYNAGRPNPNWPFLPQSPGDWYRKVGSVPTSELTGQRAEAGAA